MHAFQKHRRAVGVSAPCGHDRLTAPGMGRHLPTEGPSSSRSPKCACACTGANSNPEPAEFIRSFQENSLTSYPPAVHDELRQLGRLTRSDGRFQHYFNSPKERCAAALEPVSLVLKDAGYQTRVRGMYLWSSALDKMPANHFMVLAKKSGEQYAVDVTAGQFRNLGLVDGIIKTEEDWARTFHEAAKGRLIKYKDFDTAAAAKKEFHPMKAIASTDILDNATLLTNPVWYQRAVRKMQRAKTDGVVSDRPEVDTSRRKSSFWANAFSCCRGK